MAYSLIANTGAGGTISGVTTSAINTTGANLLVAVITSYQPNGNESLSDSKGNTWTALTRQTSSGNNQGVIYYCVPASVGTGHTFTAGGNTYSSLAVSAWSGSHVTPFDAQNGAQNTSSATLATGSVTPAEGNELVIAGFSSYENYSSINGGFTLTNAVAFSSGNHFAVGMAYLIQTTAASANPTWTFATTSIVNKAMIASFKAAAATGNRRRRTILGVMG